MSPQYPAHASPRPDYSTSLGRTVSDYDLTEDSADKAGVKPYERHDASIAQPTPISPSQSYSVPPIISPAFTPPTTPGGSLDLSTPPSSTPIDPSLTTDAAAHASSDATSTPEDTTNSKLDPLPEVSCEVRARIPTTTGQEMFLHLYHNNADNKEHLAIVFGPYMRSKSLDAPREGETEKDRMIRGAYVGTLFPGRTSSRIEALKREAGVAVPNNNGQAAAAQATDNTAGTLPMSPVQAPQKDDEEKEAEKEEATDPWKEAPLVRIHSECYTGETVWSARCDCGEQLDEAARLMSLSPYGGVIIYLRQEGRGIGLLSKLKAYNLQDLGHDTLQANLLLRHPADARSYGLATAMLVDLGLGGPLGSRERERGIRLLTNNPEKVRAVEGPGKEVLVRQRVGMVPLAWRTGGKEGVQGKEVEKYISTKIEKFKHMFSS